MTQEEKDLLLKDLCTRLPYVVKATTTSNDWNDTYTITGYVNDRIYLNCPVYDKGDDEWLVEFVKPYLRPMSSMTEDERKELRGMTIMRPDYIFGMALFRECYYKDGKYVDDWTCCSFKIIDWLNAHHFDYRGLINNGLALEAPEGMYKNE